MAKELFEAKVDYNVVEMAADPNIGQKKAFTTQGYTFASKQFLPRLEAMFTAAADKGGQKVVENIANNPNQVTVMQPTGPGTPIVQQPQPMQLDDLSKNVDNYLAAEKAARLGLNQV